MPRARSTVPCPREPVGLKREEAAAFVRLSESKFEELVSEGLMPEPHQIDRLLIWDAEEVAEAFKLLPRRRRNLLKRPRMDQDEGEEIDFSV